MNLDRDQQTMLGRWVKDSKMPDLYDRSTCTKELMTRFKIVESIQGGLRPKGPFAKDLEKGSTQLNNNSIKGKNIENNSGNLESTQEKSEKKVILINESERRAVQMPVKKGESTKDSVANGILSKNNTRNQNTGLKVGDVSASMIVIKESDANIPVSPGKPGGPIIVEEVAKEVGEKETSKVSAVKGKRVTLTNNVDKSQKSQDLNLASQFSAINPLMHNTGDESSLSGESEQEGFTAVE